MANEYIKLTVRLPKVIDKELTLKAKEEMISKNAIIVRACKNLLTILEQKKGGLDER